MTLKWARILIGAKDRNALIQKNIVYYVHAWTIMRGQQAAQSHTHRELRFSSDTVMHNNI